MCVKDKIKNKEIKIVDTTLRDGEQTAGVAFANHEKIAIAQALSDIGIDQLEVGIPTMGGDEKATIKAICKRNLKASIMAWNRAVVSDIEQSIDCGVDAVAISLSVSDIHIQHKLKKSREWVLENMFNAVSFAHKNGLYISVNGEDASRADTDFLIEFINVAKQAGANRFRFCDTVGVMEPFATREKIEKIHKATNFDIEMHTHNDFGMATANAIAGVIGGANYIGCTVNGLGERAGNAALDGVNSMDMLIGNIAGTIGETSVIAIVIGAIILILKGIIDLRIPGTYIVTFALFIGIFGGFVDGIGFFNVQYMTAELCGGGLMLGAWFMATDYVTSPITKKGQIVYGILLGCLTGLFRLFGGSAEGVSYAIIFSNLLVPLIERVTLPKPFGKGGEK